MKIDELNKKFDIVFKKHILPKLADLENIRLEKVKIQNILRTIVILLSIITLVVFILMVSKKEVMFIGIIVAIGLAVMLCSCFRYKIENDFKKLLKENILTKILSLFGDFRLINKSSISIRDIHNLGLYNNSEFKRDDDIIQGKVRESDILISETELTHVEHNTDKELSRTKNNPNEDSLETVIDFKGLILKIKVRRPFNTFLIIQSKHKINCFIKLFKEAVLKYPDMFSKDILKYIDNNIVNGLSKIDSFMKNNNLRFENGKFGFDIFSDKFKNRATRKLEKITIESQDFNENYNIYSDSQIEARKILTPTFIEKIKLIQISMLMAYVDIVCKEDYMYIFLSGYLREYTTKKLNNAKFKYTENDFQLFEVGSIENTLYDEEIYKTTFLELASIISLVNYLSLNLKNI